MMIDDSAIVIMNYGKDRSDPGDKARVMTYSN